MFERPAPDAEVLRKLRRLDVVSSDLENLLRCCGIAALIVDADLTVRRYTAVLPEAFPGVAAELGQPLCGSAHFDLPRIVRDVIDGAEPEQHLVEWAGERTRVTVTPYRDTDDRVTGAVVTFADASELSELEDQLALSRESERQICEGVHDALRIVDLASGRTLRVNSRFESLWGLSAAELSAEPDLLAPRILAPDREGAIRAFSAEGALDAEREYRIIGIDGSVRRIWERRAAVRGRDGTPCLRIELFTELPAAETTFFHDGDAPWRSRSAMFTDSLTGLLERRGLEIAFGRELARARLSEEPLSAILLDIDGFRELNALLGPATADSALRSVGTRVGHFLRTLDVVGRLRSDEFLVLLPATSLNEAAQIAERLLVLLSDEEVERLGGPPRVTASIGVVRVPEETVDLSELVQLASEPLAQSRCEGGNRVSVGRRVSVSPEVGRSVTRILAGTGTCCFAQDIVHVADGRVYGVELLSRDSEDCALSPLSLLAAARDQGALTEIDVQFLKSCLSAARSHFGGVNVHINVIPSTLLASAALGIDELLEHSDLGDNLCLELDGRQTQRSSDDLADRLVGLRARGVKIALDNVGFARGSLESMIVLKPDMVKLDRSVVQHIANATSRREELERLVCVARRSSALLVAEGVESAQDRDVLRDMGIPLAQGFLWDRPRAVDSAT